MGQSLVKIYTHIVFSTKHRQAFITDKIEQELFSYIGGICNRLGCQTITVGGYRDHVHILCLLSKQITIMKLMEEVKGHSSKWIKTVGQEFRNFYWQNGYGAFSVYSKDVDRVVQYIRSQREHHSGRSWQDEYRDILIEHEMDFNEKFVWD
ncbi:MAG TPA: IS200/IS605 family transposase [Saprospiraceae bacterium]|nr:IS200/IS605 family transposase [Saprospiraceae bacterium]HNT20546.1 IS200/IS605 family transposase [Saprospiraceae bacterium]